MASGCGDSDGFFLGFLECFGGVVLFVKSKKNPVGAGLKIGCICL